MGEVRALALVELRPQQKRTDKAAVDVRGFGEGGHCSSFAQIDLLRFVRRVVMLERDDEDAVIFDRVDEDVTAEVQSPEARKHVPERLEPFGVFRDLDELVPDLPVFCPVSSAS